MGQVVSQRELILYRGGGKRNGHGGVCASGRFELLHPGPIPLFERARPIFPVARPAEILALLAAVDYVLEFDDSTGDFLAHLSPDVFVTSATPSADPSAQREASAIEALRVSGVRIAGDCP